MPVQVVVVLLLLDTLTNSNWLAAIWLMTSDDL
jgi:hypothetical protein